jgi:ferredoxin
MAHHTLRSGYRALAERLNRAPQGAPPTDTLFHILGVLMSEREAGLIARLPLRPFTVERAARAWGMPQAEAQRILDSLASRALLLDLEHEGRQRYMLPPPMAGFFEFSMMRIRDDVDQKLLAELFYQYMNVEEDFIRALFTPAGGTQLGRVFVHEQALPADDELEVLDYERASWVIDDAFCIGVGVCYCRHKMSHLDRACAAPMNICMTFNHSAASLVKHGVARRVDTVEARDLLEQACDHGLVQFGENVRHRVNFICHCCGCCCEALQAHKRFGFLKPVHTSNFIAAVDAEQCSGCGTCVTACPVDALALTPVAGAAAAAPPQASLDEQRCLGCGVCAPACPNGGIVLRPRARRVITPVDSVQRAVLMAVERGKLANLIFDDPASGSHRAAAAVLGAVLRLEPVKRTLAARQLNSRYFGALLDRYRDRPAPAEARNPRLTEAP